MAGIYIMQNIMVRGRGGNDEQGKYIGQGKKMKKREGKGKK